MVRELDVRLYRRGKGTPFSDWLASLRDRRTAGVIRARLNRIRLGNFGDCRPAGGGVEELRIHYGPGYRVYFGRQGVTVVVLLCAGPKKTQARDIVTARRYWKEYQDAEEDRED